MPDWFYPLMLVIILAGYVFLFLQDRLIRRRLDSISHRLDDLRREQQILLPGAPVHGESEDDGAHLERLAEIQRLLRGQGDALSELREALERLEIPAESPAPMPAVAFGAVEVEATPALPVTDSPEDAAHRWLVGEGFSCIEFVGRDERPDGTRLRLRAFRGDQIRHGWVLVVGTGVVDASLEVPTAQFP